MIYYTGKFPWVVRIWVEVWLGESKWRSKHAVQASNLLFSREGKRPVFRPRVTDRGKPPFLIRITVWH